MTWPFLGPPPMTVGNVGPGAADRHLAAPAAGSDSPRTPVALPSGSRAAPPDEAVPGTSHRYCIPWNRFHDLIGGAWSGVAPIR